MLQISEPDGGSLAQTNDDPIIGIDLGTTHSLVAVVDDGKVRIVRDDQGVALVPSVVAFGDTTSLDTALVGCQALSSKNVQVLTSIKRLMGRGVDDVKSLGGALPFQLAKTGNDGDEMVRLQVGSKGLTPVELSSCILSFLKKRAEDALGMSVTRAVITVPAYFDDAARAATRDAARLAGLEVMRLVNEPTAAALAYGLDSEAEGVYVIYDLGGGTFDISVLRLQKGVFRVLATGGDPVLGGDDFDHAIADIVLADNREVSGLESTDVRLLLAQCRIMRESLSIQPKVKEKLMIAGSNHFFSLSREQFEQAVQPLIARTTAICGDVLADAKLNFDQVQGVVLAGGMTRTPAIRTAVERFFKQEPLADVDPDETVAMGAGLQAQALGGGSSNLLLDVTPLSLGLETMGGLLERIIERNTPIPVSKSQEFTTARDGQPAMSIHIVQGERETVEHNRSLAYFTLHDIPPLPAGAARIKVTFNLDADGLLTVEARELSTGEAQRVEVKPSYGLSPDAMITMLRDNVEHAEDDMLSRLLIESRLEATRLIEATEQAMKTSADLCPPKQRKHIRAVLKGLRQAVAGIKRNLIVDGIADLDEATQDFAARRLEAAVKKSIQGKKIDEIDPKIVCDDGTSGA